MSREKQTTELNKILQTGATIAAWAGYLNEKTIRVTFEKGDDYFIKEFKFNTKNDYVGFNKELRKIYYGGN